MIVCLYSFALFLYRQLVRLVSYVKPKAQLWNEGQNSVWEGLEKALSHNTRPVVWFHTASLGEYEQGKPVMEAYRAQYPDHFILVTFFSPSGYEVRKNAKDIDFVSYLPLDGAQTSERFLHLVKPKVAIFVKYELWYFYLRGLRKRSIPTILISAIFRPNQVFFAWYGRFFRSLLTCFTQIFVQDASSKALLDGIGLEQVQVGGDTRFDRVVQHLRHPKPWSVLDQFIDNRAFMVLGSVWQADMDVLIPLINSKEFPFQWVIVPHEIHADEMKRWESAIQLPVQYSKDAAVSGAQVLIVNEVGYLAQIYRGASFAYIGGAFGAGLHNTLEASVYGPTVFFGNKNYTKFKEARDLVEFGLAYPIEDTVSLKNKMHEIYDAEDVFVNKQVQARTFVALQAGATQKIMNYLNEKPWN
ncbi:glycosyltransferase N-terminal domain-containing protein [Aquirufa sp. PLAD-142S6K]|uniref:3-deoxy-D-manno-octulosonic acid transferase n=1 Tax=Aquirufa echingensis TaxID=3096516 RepID=A0ABW6D266_9BACT